MARFNLEMSLALFSVSYKELNACLKITEIIQNMLATETKPQVIEYIFSCKLSRNVHTSPTSTDVPKTHEELKIDINQPKQCLGKTIQKSNVTVYNDKILNIITELNNLQIKGVCYSRTKKCNHKHQRNLWLRCF